MTETYLVILAQYLKAACADIVTCFASGSRPFHALFVPFSRKSCAPTRTKPYTLQAQPLCKPNLYGGSAFVLAQPLWELSFCGSATFARLNPPAALKQGSSSITTGGWVLISASVRLIKEFTKTGFILVQTCLALWSANTDGIKPLQPICNTQAY